MSLENVNADVWGIILNNVKPEAGPDYFKYHTKYYGAEDEIGRKKSSSIKDFFLKLFKPASRVKPLQLAVLIIALALLLLGIFWKDIFGLLP